jgi:hypothetical protein
MTGPALVHLDNHGAPPESDAKKASNTPSVYTHGQHKQV